MAKSVRHQIGAVIAALVLVALGVVSPVGAASSAQLVHPVVAWTTPNLIPLALSCPSENFCLAISRSLPENGAPEYSTTWNGSKVSAPQKIPNASYVEADSTGGIDNLSCPSAKFCVAVGEGSEDTTSFFWTGGVWRSVSMPAPSQIVPAPPRDSVTSERIGWTSISCVSAAFCIVAGTLIDGIMTATTATSATATTFLEWNGSTWGHSMTVQGEDAGNVSCVTTTSCMAVGSQGELWNGSRWNPSHVPGEIANQTTTATYSGISCVVGPVCLAVGVNDANSSTRAAEVIEWTHGVWHALGAPMSPSGLILWKIDCDSATFCVSFGYTSSPVANQTALATWNDGTWSGAAAVGHLLDGGGVALTSSSSDVVLDSTANNGSTLWLKG